MKYFSLIWRNLLRRKTRTAFTLLMIFIAFVLYGFLMTVRGAFTVGVEVASAERLIMMHKVSLIQLLPISYEQQIRTTPGVVAATHATWFGGTYKDLANQFAVMAVDPTPFMDMFPEFKITEADKKQWLSDRQGAIVGRDTANRYGWKVGDRVPINGTIWQPKQGETWFFNISAIYDGDKNVDKTTFYFRYDYLDENRRGAFGQVGWYTVRIADPNRSAEVGAAIDSQFANSSAETKTSPEKAFMQGFANQIGNIGFIMVSIVTGVLFVLLLNVANQMGQSVRERTSEIAVLKTLGFSNGLVLSLVLAESVVLAVIGGGLGLGLVWMMVQSGGFNNAFLPVFAFSTSDLSMGIALCLSLGLLAGILPATSAMRLRITDALRRN
ncbi:MAG: FtsX-like permease family protein [Acidobacteria bacterium]|nr:FtsX-like permease family protein [Acidobacteriota bacterium]